MSDDLLNLLNRRLPTEIQELRQQLETLVAQARLNEQVMRRFQDAELRMLSVSSFKELLQYVLQEMKETFDLDVVTLAVIDPEYEVRRMLIDLGIPIAEFPGLMCLDNPSRFHRLCGTSLAPVLGQYNVASRAPFFPRDTPPASIAILPMVRQKKLIGSLNLGSRNEGRFAPGMATDFIGRLAAILGICLENVTNSERLKHLGLTDPLTGVHNRRYFDQRLQEEVSRAQRQSFPLSCLFLDIDHFKHVNDQYGHQTGDCVLREVAWRIKGQLRSIDVLGRYGGEEFSVLLVQTDMDSALTIAERIRHSIAEQQFKGEGDETLAATLSIGVATLHDCNRAQNAAALAQQLVARADQALYRAKEGGRNCVTAVMAESDKPGKSY
ncbi:diguanylate cyclase [Sulfuricella sp. T08]|nr:diguanylate cyclase [Sulfuricella sp. T08]